VQTVTHGWMPMETLDCLTSMVGVQVRTCRHRAHCRGKDVIVASHLCATHACEAAIDVSSICLCAENSKLL